MGSALAGRPLHGPDCQPAIRLDAVRRSDPPGARLDHRRDPGGVQHIHRDRDLADPDRRLHRRLARPGTGAAADDHVRRRAGRHCLGHQRVRGHAPNAVCRGGAVRRWRRRDLRHLRRQLGQMVPRPPRPRCRAHRGRVWRRRGADGRADPPGDRQLWLCIRVLLVRPAPGCHSSGRRAGHAWADARHGSSCPRPRRSPAIRPQLHQRGGAALSRPSGCCTSCSCWSPQAD